MKTTTPHGVATQYEPTLEDALGTCRVLAEDLDLLMEQVAALREELDDLRQERAAERDL